MKGSNSQSFLSKLNRIMIHILCHSFLILTVGFGIQHVTDINVFSKAYAQEGSGSGSGTGSGTGSSSGTGTGLGNPEGFEDCGAIPNEFPQLIQECIDRNKARVTTAAPTNGEQGLTSSSDINATALQQDIAMSVFALFIAFMATVYWMTCPNQFSTLFFTAAGAAVVIFELISWGRRIFVGESSGSGIEAKAAVSSSETLNDQQTRLMTLAKEKTDDAASWAGLRKWFLYVASGLMVGGTLMAIAEAIWRITSWGTYQDNCYKISANSNIEKFNPNDIYKHYYSISQERNELDHFIYKSDFKESFYNRDNHKTEVPDLIFPKNKLSSVNIYLLENLNVIAKDDIEGLFAQYDRVHAKDAGQLTDSQYQEKYYAPVQKIFNSLIPEAQANAATWWSVIAGVFAAIVIGITIFYKSWESVSATSGWVRAVFFGLMAGMMIFAAVIAADSQSKLEQRSKAYQNIIDALKTKIDAPPAGGGPAVGSNPNSPPPGSPGAAPPSGSTPDPVPGPLGGCSGGTFNQNTGPTNDPNCGCAATNSCTPFPKIGGQQIPSGVNMADFAGISSDGNLARNGVIAMTRNETLPSGFGNFGSASFAKKNKKLADKLKAKYMDLLRKKGEKNPKSFEQLEKEFSKKVFGDMAKVRNGLSPDVMAKINQMNSGSSKEDDAKKIAELAEIGKKVGVSIPAITPPSGGGKLFDDDDSSTGSGIGASENVDTANALDQFQNAEQDIQKDSGVSIWEQLSNRYRRSAFPIFFVKRKELETDAKATTVPAPGAPPAGAAPNKN